MSKSQKIKTISTSGFIFNIFNVIVLLTFALACIYPFYYMLSYAFSTPEEALKGVTLYPLGFTFDNFYKVLQIDNMPQAAFISLSRTAIGALITLICCTFLAYLVSKPEMYFRKFVYRFIITTMYVSGGLIPTYLVMRMYGLRNTFFIYILPTAVSAYYVVLLKTFIEQLPAELEESALLDGAGIITCWARIVVPLSKPILATIAVFAVVAQWNSWFDAHIYVTKTGLYPLQYVLYNYLQEAQRAAQEMEQNVSAAGTGTSVLTPEAIRMTITALVTFPVLLVYPFMQRYFVKGIMLGAVKG